MFGLGAESTACAVCAAEWLGGHCPPAWLCRARFAEAVPVSHRSWLNRRQLDGSLNRTPAGFYDRVWQILERTPNGLIVAGRFLPQVILQTGSGTAVLPD